VGNHAFVSYVREDRHLVERLCRDLESNGVSLWLDREKLMPGARWQTAIRHAIAEGAHFICCFSENYLCRERTYMNEELLLAIDELRTRQPEGAWFLPVILTPCEIPDRPIGGGATLRDLQYVDLHTDWNGGLKRLINAINPICRAAPDDTVRLKVRERARKIAEDVLNSGDTWRGIRELSIYADLYGAEILPELLLALDSTNRSVKAAVAELLGKIGPDAHSAVPRLISEARDHCKTWAEEARLRRSRNVPGNYCDEDAVAFVRALAAIRDQRSLALFAELAEITDISVYYLDSILIPALRQLGPSNSSVLRSRYLLAAPAVKLRLAFALAQLSESRQDKEHFVAEIMVIFRNRPEVMADSLEALFVLAYTKVDGQVALAAASQITSLLKDSADPIWREKAAHVIATQGFGGQVKEILLRALNEAESDPNPEVRRASYEAIRRITADYDSY
jgi:hypothetical protein